MVSEFITKNGKSIRDLLVRLVCQNDYLLSFSKESATKFKQQLFTNNIQGIMSLTELNLERYILYKNKNAT